MPVVRFKDVWKLYGDVPVVSNLNLEINDNEFLVFVGPSGCGKTTSLRMLAGLEAVTHGAVLFGDNDVTKLPSGKRDISMVFQSYALYPNMTVAKNLSFGPTVRREDKAGLPKRIEEVSKILGIDKLLDRKPSDLSGGQRQRVALGRALIRQPQLFLLDEPLSNLDAALRVQMREEIIRLHTLIEATTVYVTHDQVEAMTMGDRIAVMDQGRLLQVGTPGELFDNPKNLFVATFVGTPRMNTFPGIITREAPGGLELSALGATVPLLPWQVQQLQSLPTGAEVTVGLRSTDIRLKEEATQEATASVEGTVTFIEDLGSESFANMDVRGTSLKVRLPRTCVVRRGAPLELAFGPGDYYLFDPVSEVTLTDRPLSRS
jgi:multiple sugar transport system ATP-binding protein